MRTPNNIATTLFSIPDFMASTGLGRTKVYQLIGSGELESVTVGRRRMIPVEALHEWVGRLRTQSRVTEVRP